MIISILVIYRVPKQLLKIAAKELKNDSLSEACEYAYKKGLENKLNADYRMIEADIIFYNQPLKASIWVNFKGNSMSSKLTLEINNAVVFEKNILQTESGNEFFLEIYKSIEFKEGYIIIKGHREGSNFPLKLPIDIKDIFL